MRPRPATCSADMRSGGFKGLYLAHQERRIRYFHQVLNDYLARP